MQVCDEDVAGNRKLAAIWGLTLDADYRVQCRQWSVVRCKAYAGRHATGQQVIHGDMDSHIQLVHIA